MKKILFGICALALSATAFGAVSSELDENGNGSVGLPVRIQANVVEGSNRLFIEGTAGGTFGDILELNFGDLSTGQSGKTDGTIQVYKGLEKNGADYVAQTFGKELKLTVISGGASTDFKVNTPIDIELTNGADQATLGSRLTLTSMSFDQAKPEDSTLLTAKVMATTDEVDDGTDHTEGQYYGSTTITAVLTDTP